MKNNKLKTTNDDLSSENNKLKADNTKLTKENKNLKNKRKWSSTNNYR